MCTSFKSNFPELLLFTDERETVQKKTFTKWVNSHLQRVNARVNDLYSDLKDGRKLILLLEILSGEKLVSFFLASLFNKLVSVGSSPCSSYDPPILCDTFDIRG